MRPDHSRLLDAVADPQFADAVIDGLSHADKSLPCRYFYDEIGSELFEDITRTRDYYPTRTEALILRRYGSEMAGDSDGAVLVEFGSGSSLKTELLLAHMPHLRAYAPIDVSPSALAGAVRRLGERFPKLPVLPVVGSFTDRIDLPASVDGAPRIGFFPGSTIGNFAPADAQTLLRKMRETLGTRARLIVGIDLRKDARRLVAAYNDNEGVTAAFNLNLLARINRELAGTFDLQFFRHEAIWNSSAGRVEMYLVSERAQIVEVLGRAVRFGAEERIHTENSYKYTPSDFSNMAAPAGWQVARSFHDPDDLFAVFELRSD